MRLAAALCALMLAACATSETIILRNMAGQMLQCGPYPAGLGTSTSRLIAESNLRNCVTDFQRQGYERVLQ